LIPLACLAVRIVNCAPDIEWVEIGRATLLLQTEPEACAKAGGEIL
jgi:hypothetical protein